MNGTLFQDKLWFITVRKADIYSLSEGRSEINSLPFFIRIFIAFVDEYQWASPHLVIASTFKLNGPIYMQLVWPWENKQLLD